MVLIQAKAAAGWWSGFQRPGAFAFTALVLATGRTDLTQAAATVIFTIAAGTLSRKLVLGTGSGACQSSTLGACLASSLVV
jgi:hypothetical protein